MRGLPAVTLVCGALLLLWGPPAAAALDNQHQPRRMPLLSAPREVLATGDFSLIVCVQPTLPGGPTMKDAASALDGLAQRLRAAIDTDSRFVATAAVSRTPKSRPHCIDDEEVEVRAIGDHRRHAMSQLSVALFGPERQRALGIDADVLVDVSGALKSRRLRPMYDDEGAAAEVTPPLADGGGRHFFAANATANADTASTAPVAPAPLPTGPANTTSVTAAPPTTPVPSTLPPNVTAAATATIRINGSAFAALLVLNRTAVVEAVSADIGTLIDVAPRFIFVTNLYVGSLVVDFAVDADGGVLPHVIAERLATATRSSVWLTRTQAIYIAVSDETLRVSVAPAIAATAPPGTVTPPPLPAGNAPGGASIPPDGDESPAASRRSSLLLVVVMVVCCGLLAAAH